MKATANLATGEQPTDRPTQSFFEDPLAIQTILVATDLSEDSFCAGEAAVLLAKRFEAKVHLTYVYSSQAFEFVAPLDMPGRLQAEARRRLSLSLSLNECHVRVGRPFEEIIATAQENKAGLIVLGTKGASGLPHMLLGSTAEKVVRHANCPVLVTRAGARKPSKANGEIVLEKILVPVDFSECAREGARYASVFATRVGADLELLHIITPPLYLAGEGGFSETESTNLIQAQLLDAEDKLDELVNFLPLVNISAETRVGVGPGAECIVAQTRRDDIDMVVTSTHGRTGLRRALLGSVAEQLVRTAHCPVLVVPSHRR